MSVFAPINDDHAVESVSFSVIFDEPFGHTVFTAAQASHGLWRDELPAAQVGGLNSNDGSLALAYSYLRPDGTPAWQLKFEGAVIEVSCRRYTRWAKVWQIARRLLDQAGGVVAGAADMASASAARVRLQVVDKFTTAEAGYDASGLFQRDGGLLPRHLFDVGPLWHNNAGWFTSGPTGKILNHLNVASSRQAEDGNIAVSLTHMQELRLQTPLPVGNAAGLSSLLEKCMGDLHGHNKSLVVATVAPAIAERISLIRTEQRA